MVTIKIAGRQITLLFNMQAWVQMEKEVCMMARVNEILTADKESRTSDNLELQLRLARILGNAGLSEDGKEADLTDEWMLKNLKPVQAVTLRRKLIESIGEGMVRETEDEGKTKKERDIVLEEIESKKTAGD